jgi:hypothetical protein
VKDDKGISYMRYKAVSEQFSVPDEALFDFVWYRHKNGYEATYVDRIDTPSPGFPKRPNYFGEGAILIQPKDEEIESYRPFKEFPGLFKDFAELAESSKDVGVRGMSAEDKPAKFKILQNKELQFVNKYGLLTNPQREIIQLWEPAYWFFLDIYDCYENRGKDDFAETVIEKFSSDPLRDLEHQGVSGPLVKLGVRRNPDLSHTGALQFVFLPVNLISGIYIQLAKAITQNTNFRQCAQCGNWFPFGPGTGHRKDAQFCRSACRLASHRARKSKEESDHG